MSHQAEQEVSGTDQSPPQPVTHVLAPNHPFDSLVLTFADQLRHETAPTLGQQRELLGGIRKGNIQAAVDLLELNRPLIATVAYPYRDVFDDDTQALIDVGEAAFFDASTQYDFHHPDTMFTNVVSEAVDAALQAEHAEQNVQSVWNEGELPIRGLYRFASRAKKGRPVKIRKRNIPKPPKPPKPPKVPKPRSVPMPVVEYTRTTPLTPLERQMVKHSELFKYLHLPDEAIAEKLGISVSGLYNQLKPFKEQLGSPNRQQMVLMAMDAGIKPVTRSVPVGTEFSYKQQQVLSRLHLTYEEIAEQTGIVQPNVVDIVTALKRKLRARTRTELVVMNRRFNLAPDDMIPDYLLEYSDFERQFVPFLHMEDTELIMAATNTTTDSVGGAIARMLARSGLDNRRQLALHLQDQGYEFAIAGPPEPLNELFTAEQLLLAENADKSNEEIAALTGLPLGTVPYHIRQLMKKIGARTRTDLLLMTHKYKSGEFKPAPEKLTKRQLLESKLGHLGVSQVQLEALLEKINPRESVLILDYYFSPEDTSWRDVANANGLGRTLSMVMARHGLLRVKKMLDAQNEEETI